MKTPRIRTIISQAGAATAGLEEPKRKLNPKKKKLAQVGKLSKTDPDYFSKIGKISAEKRIKKKGTSYYSDMAKLSHPRANGYHGGRPKKKIDAEPTD